MRLCQFSLAAVAVLFIIAAPVLATELGDPAPPLKVKEWVKGKPVDLKAGKGKNIYVIEFWATWCLPCIKGMPHLTELQEKYKDKGLVIVSVTAEDRRQDLPKVKEFVKDNDSKMGYVVAYDDGRATTEAYRGAFDINTIPHAFVIDKQGRLAWHGNPNGPGMETALEELLAGKYDLEKAKKADAEARAILRNRAKARELMTSYFEAVSESEDAEAANKLAKELMPLIEKDPMSLNELSWDILTRKDVLHRDLELALRAAKIAVKLTEEKDAAILDTYARALWDTGEKEKALEYQRKAVRVCDDDRTKADLEKVLKEYERELDK
jgi:thiol-disulfide isomerase/thioredoxin